MKNYNTALQQHLGKYAKRRLGVFEKGTWKGRQYAHILPPRLRSLNFLESFRAELQDHLQSHPKIKLHQYFHHLNSSQAFALNLFYPFFSTGRREARILSASLGVDADVLDWEFEAVPVKQEGTNVDVAWRTPAGLQVFCEVKLSESAFGTAKNDSEHQKKLKDIYRPQLVSIVPEDLLEEKAFFKNYQILRYIALLTANVKRKFVILAPRVNQNLLPPLKKVLDRIDSTVRVRIGVVYMEDLLRKLQESPLLSLEFRQYAEKMHEKYVI